MIYSAVALDQPAVFTLILDVTLKKGSNQTGTHSKKNDKKKTLQPADMTTIEGSRDI